MMRKLTILTLLCMTVGLTAQTISEKRASLQSSTYGLDPATYKALEHVNARLEILRGELRHLHSQATQLDQDDAPVEEFADLAERVKEVRTEIEKIQEEYQQTAAAQGKDDPYALWHQPWTSIEQLVVDYSSHEYVYAIPPEVGGIRLSITSSLAVPRESWDELLKLILTQNGIGMRQVNPFLRQLYLMSERPSSVAYVTGDRDELDLYPPTSRVAFVINPAPSELQTTHAFLTKFLDPSRSTIHRVGRQLFILSTVETIQEVMKVYDFVEAGSGSRGYELVTLSKVPSKEMESIVNTYFETQNVAQEKGISDPAMLRVVASEKLGNALFLSGPRDAIREARRLIEHVEGEISDPRRKTVFRYQVKHSDPEELAAVLNQVYTLMLQKGVCGEGDSTESVTQNVTVNEANKDGQPTGSCLYGALSCDTSAGCNPISTCSPINSCGDSTHGELPKAQGSFVVSPKTGTIIMVVEQDLLGDLKRLLHKLDVPKRMVKIEVLLFEKRIDDRSRFGLDALKLGSAASNTENRAGFSYDNPPGPGMGLVQFLVNAKKSTYFPAFDFVFNFLMAREDIRINQHPSVTTVNSTPATISLEDEISIDTGTYIVDPNSGNNILGRAFSRQQYGITITITPTINAADEDDPYGMETITMETDVKFDTIQRTTINADRPPVLRRQIKNEVRIPNGQTLVMGGLRSKDAEDVESGLPFLSEIPCFGKFFGHTEMRDREREMYIFITPTIIDDTAAEMYKFKYDLWCKRPGDIPEFLQRLEKARACEQKCLYERTLNTIFGRPEDRCCFPAGLGCR